MQLLTNQLWEGLEYKLVHWKFNNPLSYLSSQGCIKYHKTKILYPSVALIAPLTPLPTFILNFHQFRVRSTGITNTINCPIFKINSMQFRILSSFFSTLFTTFYFHLIPVLFYYLIYISIPFFSKRGRRAQQHNELQYV